MVAINKAWEPEEGQVITVNKKKFNVQALIHVARSLPVKHLPLADFNIDYSNPAGDRLRSFVAHMKMVLAADMSFPIILSEDGYILDGRHRLAKALLEGHTTIATVRFEVDPTAAYDWV